MVSSSQDNEGHTAESDLLQSYVRLLDPEEEPGRHTRNASFLQVNGEPGAPRTAPQGPSLPLHVVEGGGNPAGPSSWRARTLSTGSLKMPSGCWVVLASVGGTGGKRVPHIV